ncbi:ankyrin repeat-containing protein At5g02620-like [Pistacia vera]|uniref:ankyrin repeat-containing protein At5g02620-like n=1 Tax=Pistacia vera TaxID=55513 RepID=UPI001263AC72|nr:ankyrin repeat-containing protein At5g02620-like [Pistacia vera]
MLPIHVAAEHGHKDMVEYLYEVTKDELTEKDRIELIRNLISRADLFDEALQLLKEHPKLAMDNLGYEWRRETALHILAGTPMMPPNLANQNQQGILKRYFNIFPTFVAVINFTTAVSDSDKLPAHEKLSPQTKELLHLLLKNVDYGDTWIDEVINVAVAQDNIELLSMIICHYPELICKVDGDTDTCGRIFCNAVWKRRKDIFKLLKKNVRPRFQRKLLQKVHQYKDDAGNNILHYAGMSPPSDKLDTISGVAFQLQQELLWFQIVNPLVAEAKNEKSQTPKALFSEEHKQLKEKGEKWMKDTANSCMIVATLIATVVFAAAFTVPGGIKEESGTPHFAHKLSFKIFVISDAISLVLSVYSILTFLSILTSRYAEEDFLSKLPKKLVMGLVTLLLSIAAMMAVFVTTVFIVFKVEKIWVRVLLCLIASLPVIELAKQSCPLLFDVVRLMFKRSFLFEDKFWNWLKAKYMYFGYVRRRCYRRCRNSFWSIRHTVPVSKGTKM